MQALRLIRLWPLAVFVMVNILNTDAMVLNHQWLQDRFRISLGELCLSIMAISLVELVFEYWFFGWLGRGAVREAPDLWTAILSWLRRRADRLGVRPRLEAAVVAYSRAWESVRVPGAAILQAMDVRHHPAVRKGGYPALTVLSVAPIFGGRTIAILGQRAAHLPGGVVIIAVCSSLRIGGLLYGLAAFMWLPVWVRMAIGGGVLIVLGVKAVPVLWRHRRRKGPS